MEKLHKTSPVNSVSLSSDGTIVAIGAHGNDAGTGSYTGHVRVFQFDGTSWSQMGNDIDGEAQSDQFGVSVSLSSDGMIVASGAHTNDGTGSNAGHARVLQWDGTSWSQMGNDIDGEAENDQSGNSVSLSSDGTIVAIGALLEQRGAPIKCRTYAREYLPMGRNVMVSDGKRHRWRGCKRLFWLLCEPSSSDGTIVAIPNSTQS